VANDVEVEAYACMHEYNHHLEIIMRKMMRATITTGNTNSNGIPGGEIGPIKNGPKTSIATIIKKATIDP
jgi:hypothetical protein